MSDENVLTKEIAEQFLADEDSVDLSEFTAIEDDAAEVLATAKSDRLILSRIRELSENATIALSQFQGKYLVLNEADIACPNAKHFRNFGGEQLSLGITELTADDAGDLAKWKGDYLLLNRLQRLSDESVAAIAQWQGGELHLKGLSELTEDASRALGGFSGYTLYLDGLTSLSEKAAQGLACYEGEELFLRGLTHLTSEAAKQFQEFQGDGIFFGKIDSWSSDLLLAINDWKFDRSEFDCENFSQDVDLSECLTINEHLVNILPQCRAAVKLNSITDISDQVASRLKYHQGRLELLSLKSISDEAAESLAEHKDVVVDLDMLPQSAARILRKAGHGE